MMRPASLFAAALLASAAAATPTAAQPMRPESVIRVTGTGEVRAAPDQATTDFAVETQAVTAQEAAAENARRMERVIAALVRAGVPRDRIETRDYNVFPEMDHRPAEMGGEPRIRGYRVMNTVSATLHDVDRVGGVIDAALQAGANRVHGVRFGLRDPHRFRQQAIADAVRRARTDAEAMAQALGVTLGAVREAQTTEFGMVVPPVMYARDAMAEMAASAPTPVSPSQQLVRAMVTVTYGIGAQTP